MANLRVSRRTGSPRTLAACLLWLAGLWLASGLKGCAVEDRQLGSSDTEILPGQGMSGDAGRGRGVPEGRRPLLGKVLGLGCIAGSECDSGFCVDGVCCNTGCSDVCGSCSAPGSEGTCSPTASEELCSALRCPPSTECRGVDESQLGSNCDGVGTCRRNAACQVSNFEAGTSCQNGTGACNGEGACAVEGKQLLGASCTADEQCAEGHCVPNEAGALICCDAACDGECQRCGASGHCEATPTGDPRCPIVVCPVDNVCRDYAGDIADNSCRGFGQCAVSNDCTFTELRPAADCDCDAAGACTLQRGKECNSDSECASGACVETGAGRRVCCSEACGAGLSCAADGRGCVECSGSQLACDGIVELRCEADGRYARKDCPNGCTPGLGCNEQPGVGASCATEACADGLTCQADVAGVQRCCVRDCGAEGRVCAENGSCACAPEQQGGVACLLHSGDPCTQASECESGECVDGVCCQEACGGACERCEAGTGACVAVAPGQADTLCNTDHECGGTRGDCRLSLREPCTEDVECFSANCEQAVAGGQRCCALDCGPGKSCSSDGLRCVACEAAAGGGCGNGCNDDEGVCNPLRPVGAPCALAQQCAEPGLCLIDNTNISRCCEANCSAQGKVCDGAGRCVCGPNQVEIAGQCRSQNGQACSDNTSCASNACELVVGGGRRCCARDCSATELCAADGASCIDQRGAVGAACTTGADCQNNNCVNGVCCSGNCGPCQRCAQATGICQPDPSAACTLTGGVAGDCNAAGVCVDPGVGPGQLCGARPCQAGLVCTASGVCCAGACNGACESACSNGSATCNTPATDARCGQTQCSAPQCQQSTPLQTNRSCAGPGQCAAASADRCSAPTAVGGTCTLAGGGAGECRNGTCSQPLRALGASCTQDSQCQLGFCTDGVCCESRCNGLCAQCLAGSGACVAASNDTGCTATCPSSDCRLAGSFGGANCRSLGVCKTAADCSPGNARADGTACGGTNGSRACFGGTCNNGPVVGCGGVLRPITATMICCESRDQGQFSGNPREIYTSVTNCPRTALDLIGTTPVTCDGTNDCGAGQVCCASSGRFASAIECLPQADCNFVDGGSTSWSVVCGSPIGSTSTCLGTGTCNANANLGAYVPGWSLCSVPPPF